MGNTSPLESLAAFAVVFAAGMAATAALQAYGWLLKRQTIKK
jgi:hypothetical protein